MDVREGGGELSLNLAKPSPELDLFTKYLDSYPFHKTITTQNFRPEMLPKPLELILNVRFKTVIPIFLDSWP